MFLIDEDPKTYQEALNSVESSMWKEAIKSELDSLTMNQTWDLVDLPMGSKPIKCKWIFKRKTKPNGSIKIYKARLMVVGYTQKQGIDYFDTYSPVTKIATIRALIALVVIHSVLIHQMGCENCISQWWSRRRNLYDTTLRLQGRVKKIKYVNLKKFLYDLKQAL